MSARDDAVRAEREAPNRGWSGGFRIGRIAGVDIEVDWSLLVIFVLIAVNLGTGVFPSWHPQWSLAMRWGVALGAAVAFFASVLAHELSHAIVGRAQGIAVRRITLFLFGGMAHMDNEPRSPKAELAMAAVGPLTSLAIGALATLAGVLLVQAPVDAIAADPEQALRGAGPIASLLLWLGPINILLAVFNLVPGFPLDGGRVLRSLLWWSTGDLVKATRWASGVGRVFAWGLMGWGVFELLGGAFVSGVWLLLIGWFLGNAARGSYAQLLVQHALQDVPVADLMFRRPRTVAPDLDVDRFVRDHLMAGDQTAYPVVADGMLRGLVTFQDVRRVARQDWPRITVAEIMTEAADLVTLAPNAEAERALEELGSHDIGQLPVVDQGRLLGLVRRSDLVKWAALQRSTPRIAWAHE